MKLSPTRFALRAALLALLICWATLAARTVNYAYDQTGRLTSVVYPNGTTATYTYDAGGNLLRKVIAAKPIGTPPAPFNNGVVNGQT